MNLVSKINRAIGLFGLVSLLSFNAGCGKTGNDKPVLPSVPMFTEVKISHIAGNALDYTTSAECFDSVYFSPDINNAPSGSSYNLAGIVHINPTSDTFDIPTNVKNSSTNEESYFNVKVVTGTPLPDAPSLSDSIETMNKSCMTIGSPAFNGIKVERGIGDTLDLELAVKNATSIIADTSIATPGSSYDAVTGIIHFEPSSSVGQYAITITAVGDETGIFDAVMDVQ